MDSDERRAQYKCDVTYGTNSEFGFDYLRDNGMAQRREEAPVDGGGKVLDCIWWLEHFAINYKRGPHMKGNT